MWLVKAEVNQNMQNSEEKQENSLQLRIIETVHKKSIGKNEIVCSLEELLIHRF